MLCDVVGGDEVNSFPVHGGTHPSPKVRSPIDKLARILF